MEPGFEAIAASVYQELRRMAGGLMRGERGGHTLQPTALVNEAYLRLRQTGPEWESREHFFGAAARAMRQILIDYARKRSAEKRGADAARVTFDEIDVQAEDPTLDLLDLDRALTALSEVDPRLTAVMELRYFTGCTLEEIAEIQGVSLATVKRDWTYARAWLFEYLGG